MQRFLLRNVAERCLVHGASLTAVKRSIKPCGLVPTDGARTHSFTMSTRSGDPRRSDTNQAIGNPQSCVINVLIAHCDPLIAAGLVAVLGKRRDFKAVVCSPAATSQGMASHLSLADVVVADYDYGLRLIESAGAGSHRVIILTHRSSEAKICHALEQGARGYVLLGGSLQNLFDDLR